MKGMMWYFVVLFLILFEIVCGINIKHGASRGLVNPFKKNAHIAIIGAGPAGIHMALLLKRHGYENVTVLEKTTRVGGKSYTVYLKAAINDEQNPFEECEQIQDKKTGIVDTLTCLAYEMGTTFLHSEYHLVRKLIQEYNLVPEIAPEGRAVFSQFSPFKENGNIPSQKAQRLGDFVLDSIMANAVIFQKVNPIIKKILPRKLIAVYLYLKGLKKYNKLHFEIFGDVEFTLPERLSREKMLKINMPFDNFLKQNNIEVLIPLLKFALSAQGYGFITTTPTFYGLMWITPRLINSFVQQTFHQEIEEIIGKCTRSNDIIMQIILQLAQTFVGSGQENKIHRTTTMLPEGFGKIWKTIHEKEKLNVIFGAQIKYINRHLEDPSAPVTISYNNIDGQLFTDDFDFLIYTPPFRNAKKYINDLTIKENIIFDSYRSFVLTTTIYASDEVFGYTDPGNNLPIMYNLQNMVHTAPPGNWYADTHELSFFGNKNKIINTKKVQVRKSYQFYEDGCDAAEALCDTDRVPYRSYGNDGDYHNTFDQIDSLKITLDNDFKRLGVKNVTMYHHFPWPYFHHLTQDAIHSGMIWDLIDIQGHHKTWYLGASASFESVHDVMNYNEMIMKRFIKVGGEKKSALEKKSTLEKKKKRPTNMKMSTTGKKKQRILAPYLGREIQKLVRIS